jgi:hypothetical protein
MQWSQGKVQVGLLLGGTRGGTGEDVGGQAPGHLPLARMLFHTLHHLPQLSCPATPPALPGR